MAAAVETTDTAGPRIELLRRAVKARRVVISSDPGALVRAHRDGRVVFDAREIAARLRNAEPEFFGPAAGEL